MVQMIALQTVYVFSQRKEYREGVTFDVADAREAESLHAMKKAMRVTDKPKHVEVPRPVDTRQMEPQSPKKTGGRGRTYQRRDMTATDGQTGDATPLPSSPPAPQPEEPISTTSEAAPE